ncbi:DUF4276 family protein [uncultured Duncaniella sp.]|uniref:DUF4276 family protein n=1 Tax=uncultured Duncaniella sp. TaxID=2768039 RepID=UPI0025FAA418|nr:DUF4276 family protein [uncultured Duncaniella sp.]
MSRKIAVYVEGDTELIFVREFLLKWFGYDGTAVGFRCYNLRDAEPPGHPTEYTYGADDPERFYEIVNVGNDTSVLSKVLKNAERYRNLDFERVVALRDMYCDNYHKLTYGRTINQELNTRFIEGAAKSIADKGFSGFVMCHFAIMEVEAWVLGMGWYLERMDQSLTQQHLLDSLGLDLEADPETTEYHPADRLNDIYGLIGTSYGKHHTQANSIMGLLDKDDFMMLMSLGKCSSFSRFASSLLSI